MTKIRMNTELRNKLFNKIKNVFENEDTQEREAFLQQEKSVDNHYEYAQQTCKEVVERVISTRRCCNTPNFQKESMDNLVMLLQKINVFTLHIMRTMMMRAKQRNKITL